MVGAPYRRYVALGDSFTEGLNDELGPDGRHRGWADRFALQLTQVEPELMYANLAVRGKLISQVVNEQVPAAIALEPDLVTFAAGVNDALRRHFNLDDVVDHLRRGVGSLRESGATVILFAFGDPSRRSRVMGSVADRLWAYNRATRAVAREQGALLVDFWGAAVFDDDRFWSPDRLHLSPDGHHLAAQAALEAVGANDDRWRTPQPSRPPASAFVRIRGHSRWAAAHLAPWVGRRVRGVSSGDGIDPKRPTLEPIRLPTSPRSDLAGPPNAMGESSAGGSG